MEWRQRETKARADRLIERLKGGVERRIGDIASAERTTLEGTARTKEERRIKEFDDKLSSLKSDFETQSETALKRYNTLYSKAEQSYISQLLSGKTPPHEVITEIISGESFMQGANVTKISPDHADRMLMAITTGSIGPLIQKEALDVKDVLRKIDKGSLKPLPPQAQAGFLLAILKETGIRARGRVEGFPANPSDYTRETFLEMKRVIGNLSDIQKGLFFGKKRTQFNKQLDEILEFADDAEEWDTLWKHMSSSFGIGVGGGTIAMAGQAWIGGILSILAFAGVKNWASRTPAGKEWIIKASQELGLGDRIMQGGREFTRIPGKIAGEFGEQQNEKRRRDFTGTGRWSFAR